MTRQLHLNLFIQSRGHHEAAWNHPDSSAALLTDVDYYVDLAQRAEAALFDSIFFADSLMLTPDAPRSGRLWLEPVTLLAALAVATEGRADRDGLEHIFRGLQPRAAVQFDRSHEQWPRRLEYRHHLDGEGRAQLR